MILVDLLTERILRNSMIFLRLWISLHHDWLIFNNCYLWRVIFLFIVNDHNCSFELFLVINASYEVRQHHHPLVVLIDIKEHLRCFKLVLGCLSRTPSNDIYSMILDEGLSDYDGATDPILQRIIIANLSFPVLEQLMLMSTLVQEGTMLN